MSKPAQFWSVRKLGIIIATALVAGCGLRHNVETENVPRDVQDVRKRPIDPEASAEDPRIQFLGMIDHDFKRLRELLLQ